MQKYLEVRYGAKGKSRRTNGRDASGGDEMTHHDDLFILSEKAVTVVDAPDALISAGGRKRKRPLQLIIHALTRHG